MSTKFQLKISLILLVLVSAVRVQGQTTDSVPVKAVYSEVRYKPIQYKALIVPAAFMAYGFSAPYIKPLKKLDDDTNYELREDHPRFGFHVDDYLRYAPIAAVYGLDLTGVKSKHNFVDRTAMLLLSTAIAGGSTFITKNITSRTRPNGLDNHSFPSGHSSMAFMAAEFMHQEYKDQSPWYSILGYSMAVTTATLRLYNGAHWFSDVVAGAGYGVLSTKISYWAYPFIKDKLFHNKANHTVLVPFHQEGHTGLTFVRKL
ncbi:phosphatase PAP2 family protein [Pedobacter nyackensis]|uniref:PAP2 superfamily protein n=1 Tax=Pedobacter nyackensis TaxID=475255 RepID=A0A1W2C8G8_9SPHI|nr:phosphatase PAP2 family protein [Pedobacter nyackensis]SMC81577.1 PAP2 superfamily protein [Pedobacter nyackensis]